MVLDQGLGHPRSLHEGPWELAGAVIFDLQLSAVINPPHVDPPRKVREPPQQIVGEVVAAVAVGKVSELEP